MLYGHGDDLHAYASGQINANFSTNIWPFGPAPALVTTLKHALDKVQHYPEPAGRPFINALMQHYALPEEYFLATNGTAEAIYLIAQAYRQTSATIFTPTFAEYEDACQLHQIQTEFMPWQSLEQQPEIRTQLAFICHPNNPTGQTLALSTLADVITSHPEVIFIVDEAYAGFTRQPASMMAWLAKLPNLVILRSLTKLFALSGLRLGYLAAQPALVEKVSAFKPPWSVNSLAVIAGEAIYQNYCDYLPDVRSLLDETDWFSQQLAQIDLLEVTPSDTHYLLLNSLGPSAAELKQALAVQGFLIRDASNFRGLTPQHFRLATLDRQANLRLLEAIQQWR